VFLDPHEDACFRARLSLWRTCKFISSPSKSALYGGHTARLKRKVLWGNHADLVRHHRHPMQGRLPVEEHDVPVDELSFDVVSNLDGPETTSAFLSVTDAPPVGPDDVIHPGPVFAQRPQRSGPAFTIASRSRRCTPGHGPHGELARASIGTPTSLIGQNGSGGDDRRAAEVDPLPGEVERTGPLCPSGAGQGLQGSAGSVPRRGIPDVWLSKYVVMWYWRSSRDLRR